MMKYILALLLTFIPTVHADDQLGISYGLGVFNSAISSPSEVKELTIAYRHELYKGLYLNNKIGYWMDSSDPSQGRHSSFYISTGPAVLVDLGFFEVRSGYGIAFISNPDNYLGGNFPQFNGELYLGFKDYNGNGIGLKYEHISSAGIVMPNVGRDFLTVEISKRW